MRGINEECGVFDLEPSEASHVTYFSLHSLNIVARRWDCSGSPGLDNHRSHGFSE